MNVKSLAFVIAAAIGVTAASTDAAVVLSENFDSYTTGDLVGQGGWTQLGSSVVNPLQVTEAKNVPMSTGQDAQKALSSTVTHTDGHALVFDLDITPSTADPDAAGDFFMSINPAMGSTDYTGRLYARAGTAPGTFQLAMTGPSVATEDRVFGTDLNLNATYHVTARWDFVPGESNDTFTIDVNGTPYVSSGWLDDALEPTTFEVLTLRQGGANSSNVVVDNIVVTEVIPEPTGLAIVGLGAIGLLRRRRA